MNHGPGEDRGYCQNITYLWNYFNYLCTFTLPLVIFWALNWPNESLTRRRPWILPTIHISLKLLKLLVHFYFVLCHILSLKLGKWITDQEKTVDIANESHYYTWCPRYPAMLFSIMLRCLEIGRTDWTYEKKKKKKRKEKKKKKEKEKRKENMKKKRQMAFRFKSTDPEDSHNVSLRIDGRA